VIERYPSPLEPRVFKERLFVHLSRFCEVRLVLLVDALASLATVDERK
jgi:hypothetical protein